MSGKKAPRSFDGLQTGLSMPSLMDELTKKIVQFRDARDWKQFHNPKDLALALSIEAAELNEIFLWKSHEAANKKRLAEELADVLICAMLLAHEVDIDIVDAVSRKLRMNAKKYPVKRSKGIAKKYNEL